jgi:hypothetical protein
MCTWKGTQYTLTLCILKGLSKDKAGAQALNRSTLKTTLFLSLSLSHTHTHTHTHHGQPASQQKLVDTHMSLLCISRKDSVTHRHNRQAHTLSLYIHAKDDRLFPEWQ